MTPEASFVRDLAAYDPKLRVRWARHTEKWLIERKLDKRHPQLTSEQPLPESRQGLQRDLWEGWQEGYVHVLTVPREMLHWSEVAPHLAKFDAQRQGSMAAINRMLDDEDEQWEKQTDRKIENHIEAATDDAYEHLAWASGRRVSMHQPEPKPVDSGFGFLINDRRAVKA